ncbi:transcription factor 7-like 2 [Antennarius striatus]|uniref:transcription factor 7-like 2 n=1 Tax=Antennarius striatus TaxID=241820 RepID=UPI0035B1B66B
MSSLPPPPPPPTLPPPSPVLPPHLSQEQVCDSIDLGRLLKEIIGDCEVEVDVGDHLRNTYIPPTVPTPTPTPTLLSCLPSSLLSPPSSPSPPTRPMSSLPPPPSPPTLPPPSPVLPPHLSQEQYVLYQGPLNAASFLYPPAPLHPYNAVPLMTLPPPVTPKVPPVGSLRKKAKNRHQDSKPYVKKPPNAFMLFSKEQRASVKAQLNTIDSRRITTVLGEMWMALSSAEQEGYFMEAHRLRRLHEQQYANWTPNSV